jgi:hypothetical protein
MRFLRAVGRGVVAATAVSSVILIPPAGQASDAQAPIVATTPPAGEVGTLEAGVGERCGAYRKDSSWFSEIYYRHCGTGRVKIEIDYRDYDNTFGCVPVGDTFLGYFSRISHAWAVGPC